LRNVQLYRTNVTKPNLKMARRQLSAYRVTDANDFSTNGSITLTAPNPEQISFSNAQNPSCNRAADGSVQLSMSGGLCNFTVGWNNGSFETNPTDLVSGYNAVRIYERDTAILDTGITLTLWASRAKVQHCIKKGIRKQHLI